MLIPKRLVGGGGYDIPYSMMTDLASGTYLRQTVQPTPDDIKKFTISAWVKRGRIDQIQSILSGYLNGTNYDTFFMDDTGELGFYVVASGAAYINIQTEAKFNDTSEWYHVVVQFDSAQAAAADRLTFWVNGVEQAVTTTLGVPLNAGTYVMNSGKFQTIGYAYIGANYYADMLYSEMHIVDGLAKTADDFGEFDQITGQWIPKKYLGNYGSAGFYFDFADNTQYGKDVSGNGNDYNTENALGTDHQYLDTPTNNHCIMNPLDDTGLNALEGGLYLNRSGGTGNYSIRGSLGLPRSGKWYFEHKIKLLLGSISSAGAAGICSVDEVMVATMYNAATANGFIFASGTWNKTTDGTVANVASGTAGMALNDVMQIAIDLDAGKMWVGKNGTWNNSGDPAAGTGADITGMNTDRDYVPFATPYNSTGTTYILPIMDFGQRGLDYTPPSGFKALSASNLPEPEIVKPNKNMAPILCEGTGAENSITDLEFSPDMVWIKNRDGTNWHQLFDTERGATIALFTNDTSIEITDAQTLKSFDANGFTLGTTAGVNTNANSFVAWCWKKGAIPGFDVVTYTGDGVAGRTVAHSLGAKPEFVLVKQRDTARSWRVNPEASYPGGTHLLIFDSTAAVATSATAWNNTAPDTSNVTLGTEIGVNTNTKSYVMYLWANIPGFSRIGTYTGNGSVTGPYVNTGFRPAFLMVKRLNSTGSWRLFDAGRDPYNQGTKALFPDVNNAEGLTEQFAFFSNGFRIEDTAVGINGNGSTYLFVAFAENPFKYSRAR